MYIENTKKLALVPSSNLNMASNGTQERIRLHHISHVYYKYKPDAIEAAHTFMDDFGFFEAKRLGPKTYYRGYGQEPFVLCIEASTDTEFGGAAFAVDTLEELERATKILPKEARATDVYDMTDAPGGGKCVTLYDPVDGFPMHLVYGQELVEPLDPKFPELKPNFVSPVGVMNEVVHGVRPRKG